MVRPLIFIAAPGTGRVLRFVIRRAHSRVPYWVQALLLIITTASWWLALYTVTPPEWRLWAMTAHLVTLVMGTLGTYALLSVAADWLRRLYLWRAVRLHRIVLVDIRLLNYWDRIARCYYSKDVEKMARNWITHTGYIALVHIMAKWMEDVPEAERKKTAVQLLMILVINLKYRKPDTI